MTDRFRVGIVGCGQISQLAHVPAVLRSRQAALTALVDPVEGRAAGLARDLGITPRIATAVERVLDAVDGVIIATPNHTHVGIALTCLEAGKPVLIEKPLATTVADGEAIVAAGTARGCPVAVGYTTRFYPGVALVKRLLEAGFFGHVSRFAYQFGTVGGWAPMSAYNLDRRLTGGGVLVVTGTHFIDRLLAWFGMPAVARLRDDGAAGPEANAVATFQYDGPDGLVGTARFSKTVAYPAGFVMETEAGVVGLAERPDAEVVLWPTRAPGVRSILRPDGPGATADAAVEQLDDFVDACRFGRRPLVSGADGVASLRLLEALYASRTPLDDAWYGMDRPVGVAP